MCRITRTHEGRNIKFVQKTGDEMSNGSFNVTNKEVLCYNINIGHRLGKKRLAEITLNNAQQNFEQLYASSVRCE